MTNQNDLNRLVERLERLEETQGFAERAAAGLSAEVYALARRLDELTRRVGRLERVEEMRQAVGDGKPGDEALDPGAPDSGA